VAALQVAELAERHEVSATSVREREWGIDETPRSSARAHSCEEGISLCSA